MKRPGDHRSSRSKFGGTGDPEEGDVIQDLHGRQWMIVTIEKKRTLHWTTEVLLEEDEYLEFTDWIERDMG